MEAAGQGPRNIKKIQVKGEGFSLQLVKEGKITEGNRKVTLNSKIGGKKTYQVTQEVFDKIESKINQSSSKPKLKGKEITIELDSDGRTATQAKVRGRKRTSLDKLIKNLGSRRISKSDKAINQRSEKPVSGSQIQPRDISPEKRKEISGKLESISVKNRFIASELKSEKPEAFIIETMTKQQANEVLSLAEDIELISSDAELMASFVTQLGLNLRQDNVLRECCIAKKAPEDVGSQAGLEKLLDFMSQNAIKY